MTQELVHQLNLGLHPLLLATEPDRRHAGLWLWPPETWPGVLRTNCLLLLLLLFHLQYSWRNGHQESRASWHTTTSLAPLHLGLRL